MPTILMRGRPGILLLMLLAVPLTLVAQRVGATHVAALQRLLIAEDARGTGEGGLAPLLEGIRSRDSLLRRVAARGVGRLQRPELARLLLPLLDDPVPAVRAEAANAIAQGLKRVRRGTVAADTFQLSSRVAMDALSAALEREPQVTVIDALAEALGRLPFADSTEARSAERAMRARVVDVPTLGIVHGMYSLALTRRLSGGLSPEGIVLLRRTSMGARTPQVRRLAVLALHLVGGLDSATTKVVARDADEQVRRLALAGAGGLGRVGQRALVQRALADPSPVVRVDAIGAARALDTPSQCAPLIAATRDAHPWVRLVAIDSLGAPCTDSTAARMALARIIDQARRPQGEHSWQAPSRALQALARVDGAGARTRLARYVGSPRWQERVVAGRVATILGDDASLFTLSGDVDQNVQEAAVMGLVALRKHTADSVYIAALGAPGYQVVLAAANALAGSVSERALPALLDALDRLSAERSENARDPRLAILRRLDELGSVAAVDRLTPYLVDFDTTVAMTSAALLTKWSGTTAVARPVPLPIRSERLAQVFLTPGIRLRVTLGAASGGGAFTIALFPGDAPASVARLVRLARSHFYEDGVFQRVEPNFVVQGGGPGATEYIGDSSFMRDELTPHSHFRGTVGISTRGRDTGDAQLFINVVDNPRLDHEYTVVGRIISGLAVAEHILEGDVIARVEVLGAP